MQREIGAQRFARMSRTGIIVAGLVALTAPSSVAASGFSFDLRNYPGGTLWSCMGAGAVSQADFNGDGAKDLVIADFASQGPTVLINNGDGSFQPPVTVPTGLDACTVAVGDFDGDGNADIVTVSYLSTMLTVLLGNGDGTFDVGERYPTGVWSQQVAVADFNGDGAQDLAVTKSGPGAIGLFLGNGDGTFTAGRDVPLGWEAPAVAAADLDGDGNIDLVASDDSADGVLVMLGKGDATFAEPVNYPAGDGAARFIEIADVDLDCNLDLVTANSDSNSVSVLLGHGDGSFGPEARYIEATAFRDVGLDGDVVAGVAVADFDGDGLRDIAATRFRASKVFLLAGVGGGNFAPADEYATAEGPEPVLADDFNGDGRIDLAVPGNAPGFTTLKTEVSILLNTAVSSTSRPSGKAAKSCGTRVKTRGSRTPNQHGSM